MAADPTKRVPSPPHPQARRQPLPEHSPKSTEEDPAAPQALRAIRESPTYRLAEQDAEFIARADIRGPRLEIEYLKADVILAEQHIDHTIVVYGSTRIPEPGAARRKVEALRASVRAQPGNEELSLHLAAAERISAKSHYYDVAREFGRGKNVSAGSRDLIYAHREPEDWALRVIRRASWRSALVVFVAVEGRTIGALLLADELRAETPHAIRMLRAARIGRIVMVTGDHAAAAQTIGAALDLDAVLADRVPSDKLDAVRSEQRLFPTTMVGDGINAGAVRAHGDADIGDGERRRRRPLRKRPTW